MKKEVLSNKKSLSPIIRARGGMIGYYFLNLLIIVGVPYLITKYDQNPNLIIILISILLFVVLPTNTYEYFIAYEDKLIVLYKRVFFLPFLDKKNVFNFEQINKITVSLRHGKKTDIAFFILGLTSKFHVFPCNNFDIEMKSGKKKDVGTEIYKEKLRPILDFIKSKNVKVDIIYPDKKT